MNDTEKAVEAYENLVKSSPGDAAIQFDLGSLYDQVGNLDKAQQHFAKVVELDPKFCDQIVFVGGDAIDGPVHTNDDLRVCNSPTFGRNGADAIEVSAPPVGWAHGNNCTGTPTFKGFFVTGAPVLTPPATNTTLKAIAGPANTYTGQTKIVLSGNNMTITPNGGSPVGPIPVPSDGVVYVQNGAGCSNSYSPFTVTYPSTSGCGNAVVDTGGSSYSGQPFRSRRRSRW